MMTRFADELHQGRYKQSIAVALIRDLVLLPCTSNFWQGTVTFWVFLSDSALPEVRSAGQED
jgi:hypothetical protein